MANFSKTMEARIQLSSVFKMLEEKRKKKTPANSEFSKIVLSNKGQLNEF